jgi:Flp pilus assembly protein CpaB
MRKLLVILGVVLAILVAAGVFLFMQFTRPAVLEVPVALDDIPAGTTLRPQLFRLERMANIDAQTAAKWVTVADWSMAEGKLVSSDVRAGFPVAKAQIDPNAPVAAESRLSLLLNEANDYYVVLPTKPDEVGNFLQPGDRVDIIVSIGSAERKDDLTAGDTQNTGGTSQNTSGKNGQEITATAPLPISKLVMQNLTVLRIERTPTQRNTSTGQQDQQQDVQPVVDDIKRIYVKVDRDQLEVLSFVLNNGKRTLAVRAANGSQDALASGGVTWDDFARWFFAQRGDRSDGAQPFNAVSPSAPRSASR